MTRRDEYDLLIIGAGSAGLTAALFARSVGARVALIERGRVGGDCTWTGCIPSKTLLHVAAVARQTRAAGELGIATGPVTIDFARVMEHVRSTVERVYAFETPERLAAGGIPVLRGTARFRDAATLEVDGRALRARRYLIASGAEPVLPPIPGLADTPYLTTQTIFDLRARPERLLVLGGGATGVELAQAFQRLGVAVTIIERDTRLVPQADPAASAALAKALRADGVELRLGATLERVEPLAGGVVAQVAGQSLSASALLVATGRQPALDGLDLDRAGVETRDSALVLDRQLRTTHPHIFAAGDVTGGPQFTSYAGWQGFVAARNALLPRASTGVRGHVPWVVFTDPELGQVGLTEAEARAGEGDVSVHRWPLERVDRAQTVGDRAGFIKLIARPGGELLGASIVAGEAGELVNHLALALERRLSLAELARTLHAYPTYGISVQQLSSQATLAHMTRGWRGRLLRVLARR